MDGAERKERGGNEPVAKPPRKLLGSLVLDGAIETVRFGSGGSYRRRDSELKPGGELGDPFWFIDISSAKLSLDVSPCGAGFQPEACQPRGLLKPRCARVGGGKEVNA